tara:strand:+ start:51 stop:446 length:396 start_codon:yes stop_codon:yes gene_type:complete
MKITKSQLKQIIKEELRAVLQNRSHLQEWGYTQRRHDIGQQYIDAVHATVKDYVEKNPVTRPLSEDSGFVEYFNLQFEKGPGPLFEAYKALARTPLPTTVRNWKDSYKLPEGKDALRALQSAERGMTGKLQ